MRRLRRQALRALAWVLAGLMAAAFVPAPSAGARAEAPSEAERLPDAAVPADAAAQPLAPGTLAELDLDRGDALYAFSPTSNSVFEAFLFPAGEEEVRARAELWQGRRLVASGEEGMPAFSLRLKANMRYVLRVSGSGRARLEVARHALSRCFDMPMPLDAGGDSYAKAIAREGDVHWYALEPDSPLPVALAGVPRETPLRLSAQLFDDRGRMLAESASTLGGAFLLDFTPRAGERYRVRVSAPEGGVGLYDLRVARSADGALPDRIVLSQSELALEGRSSRRLLARISPEGASELVFWESSDATVARVDAEGVVTGRRAGTTVVTAYGAGGVSARCRVEVRPVAAEGIALSANRVELSLGDEGALRWAVLPENASDRRVAVKVEPSGVVEVGKRGALRAVGEGTATVTVRTRDGDFAAEATVVVGPARKRWRALLVGEQNYASTVAAARPGSANSVTSLRSMLGTLSPEGGEVQVETLLDASRDGVLAGIRDAFAGAAEGDVSLFYITCHGHYDGGLTRLKMYDGSILTAVELEQALRRVPGEVVVIVDCCGSGGLIGAYSDAGDILEGIVDVFSGQVGPAPFLSSKYRVLASAALEQDSYRISFNEAAGESDMATAFARALCEAGGWSIDRAARSAMRADLDYDGSVTLAELYAYTARRVAWYLDLAGQLSGGGDYVQNVKVWPEGDLTPVFVRAG